MSVSHLELRRTGQDAAAATIITAVSMQPYVWAMFLIEGLGVLVIRGKGLSTPYHWTGTSR